MADGGKLATAMVGVVFSVVLVNVQGGLFFGLLGKVALLVDCGEADIWVGHKRVHNIDFPLDIPKRWLYRVRAVPGVETAARSPSPANLAMNSAMARRRSERFALGYC